jgi:hypothetical protein
MVLQMADKKSTLNIGLLENACHSLKRGYELWREGERTNDGWLLKEAIIWIHHGIELSLKQLLVQTNEFLVFEKVDDATRSLAKLRRQTNKPDAGVLELFNSEESAVSVSFHNLIQRVAIMLNLSELAEGAPLRSDIDELTKLRNRIVHFSAVLDKPDVTTLLSDILEPLLKLLEREVNDSGFRFQCIPAIRRAARQVEALKIRYEEEGVNRLARLLELFDGQEVDGTMFGLDAPIQLPHFAKVGAKRAKAFDLEGENPEEPWLIEIKFGVPNRDIFGRIVQLFEQERSRFPNARTWLVSLSDRQFSDHYLNGCQFH